MPGVAHGTRRALLAGGKLGVNLLVNPQLQNSAAGWTIVNGVMVWSATGGLNNGPSFQYTGNGSAPGTYYYAYSTLVPVVAGQLYFFGGWISTPSGITGNCTWQLSNQSNGYLAVSSRTPPYTGFVSNTYTVAAGVTALKMVAQENEASVPVSSVVYWSNPLLIRIG
jgi:hypothetical protein